MSKVFVVVPAFNEEAMVGRVVKSLVGAGFKVVVVDDGSSDGTAAAAERAGAVVLRHVVNRGQGAAIQTGIEFALEKGADLVATFDADGQHRVSDLKRMVALVSSGKCDVALGSRFLRGSGRIPWERKLLLKGAVLVQRVLYGVSLSDAHNGLRVFSRRAASALNITSDGMEHASEIAEQVVRRGISFVEVPVTIKYTDYSLRKGHGSFWQGVRILYQFLVRKLLR